MNVPHTAVGGRYVRACVVYVSPSENVGVSWPITVDAWGMRTVDGQSGSRWKRYMCAFILSMMHGGERTLGPDEDRRVYDVAEGVQIRDR